MKKLFTLTILTIILLSGCTTNPGTYDINLGYNDREIPIYTTVGKTINITLIEHPTLHWQPSIYDEHVLLFSKRIDWTDDSNSTNPINYSTFVFTTINPGQTIINIQEIKQPEGTQNRMFSVFILVEE